MYQKIILVIIASLISAISYAGDAPTKIALQLKSPHAPTQLIELFTSEGCSSCPPADAYLSKLKNSHDLWTQYVPIAMHVDYWDYIGWKDPFAKPQHASRQRNYRQQQAVRSVYTPGFVINGQEWRGFFRRKAFPKPAHTAQFSPQHSRQLSLNIKQGMVQASINTAQLQAKQWRLHIALLGMGIKKHVARGENARRTLSHDFVLLEQQDIDSRLPTWRAPLSRSFDLNKYQAKGVSKFAIAAWVSIDNTLAPVQATGGFLN